MGINGVNSNYNHYNRNLYGYNYSLPQNSYNNSPFTVESNSAFIGDSFNSTRTSAPKDGKDDGSIGFSGAIKNLAKGVGNFFKGMVCDENGKFSLTKTLTTIAIGAAIGAACVCLPAITIAGTAFSTLGLISAGFMAFAGLHAGKSAIDIMEAQTDAEAEQAWQSMGSALTEGGLAYLGYRASGGIHAKNVSIKTPAKNTAAKPESAIEPPKVELKPEKPAAPVSEPIAEKPVSPAKTSSTGDAAPIQSEEEFLEVFERVKNAKTETGEPLWKYDEEMGFYPDATIVEQGLLPYCGKRDISGLINRYLSGRLEAKPEYQDVVRVLDYSLSQLDKVVPRHEGIVFRQGFMGEKTGQYISTSKSSSCAARFNDGWFDPYDVQYRTYSVIKTKGGHDIAGFQAKMHNGFCNKEQEVLLPRQAQYREVPIEECSEELLQAREQFASGLFRDAHKLFNGSKPEVKGYTKEDLLALVKVYEEI